MRKIGTEARFRRSNVARLVAWLVIASLAPPAGAIERATLKELFPNAPKAEASKPGAVLSDIEKVKITPPSVADPVTIEADAMGYDKDAQIAIALGHVVVAQGEYILHADKITYYQQGDRIEANGNVSVLQPSGDVFFSDHTVLHDAMKRGVAEAFRARLADGTLMAANSARKVNAAVTTLNEVVYTPCHICEDMAPFWQIKADDVTMDEAEERITSHDARLEMFGVPVLYTPYLSQPTPNSGAKSGFLMANYQNNNNLGTMAKIPYYWRIAEDKDVTITPWFLSDDSPVLQGDYRQLTDRGHYTLKFAATNPQRRDSLGNPVSGNELRGSIEANGIHRLDEYSRIGFDINRTTDDTFLSRYGLSDQRAVLFSKVYAETAEQRNFASIQGVSLQGLRAIDNSKTTPLVAPTIDGYYETTPLENGLRFHASGNTQSLTREIGADQRRVSVTGGATYPLVTDGGHVFNATANVRQDVYHLNDVAMANGQPFSGTVMRTLPQAALQWRFPLIRESGGDAVTIEPLVLGVAQPKGGNPPEIANEDSKLLELTDTNLFDIDRVPGYDVVDSGDRVAYGLRAEYMLQGGESIDGLLGQNYSFSSATPYPNSTSPGKHSSDIIGRIGFNLTPITFAYRFAANNTDLSLHRSEFTMGFDRPWLNLAASYHALKDNRYLSNSKELELKGRMPISEDWKLYGSGTRDMELDRMVSAGGGLIYHNECFDLTLDGLRTFTHDRDVETDTTFSFRFAFKNLGVFGG